MACIVIQTVDELVKHLGGPTTAGEVLGGTPQMVINWRTRGQLPTRLFLSQRQALAAKSVTAPASLWGMAQAAE